MRNNIVLCILFLTSSLMYAVNQLRFKESGEGREEYTIPIPNSTPEQLRQICTIRDKRALASGCRELLGRFERGLLSGYEVEPQAYIQGDILVVPCKVRRGFTLSKSGCINSKKYCTDLDVVEPGMKSGVKMLFTTAQDLELQKKQLYSFEEIDEKVGLQGWFEERRYVNTRTRILCLNKVPIIGLGKQNQDGITMYDPSELNTFLDRVKFAEQLDWDEPIYERLSILNGLLWADYQRGRYAKLTKMGENQYYFKAYTCIICVDEPKSRDAILGRGVFLGEVKFSVVDGDEESLKDWMPSYVHFYDGTRIIPKVTTRLEGLTVGPDKFDLHATKASFQDLLCLLDLFLTCQSPATESTIAEQFANFRTRLANDVTGFLNAPHDLNKRRIEGKWT